MNPLGLAAAHVGVPLSDGSWAPQRVIDIVDTIRMYDPNLDVHWIPPSQRAEVTDPAYAVVEKLRDGRTVVSFYVQDESQFDGTVLERIFTHDAAKHGNILSALDAKNAAAKALSIRQKRAELDEAYELAYSILKSPLHTFKHDGKTYHK